MITGANTNVRYRGIIFHVQTEDSGRANPHIISHVYHGGTILASEKTDYADQTGAGDLEAIVRGRIEEQHREMVKRLLSGGLDAAISERLGDTAVEKSGPLEAPTPMPATAEPAAASPEKPKRAAPEERQFGEGIVSQKPLDEVILDYLAGKARERGAGRDDAASRKSRSGG